MVQALVQYPGLQNIRSASLSFSHGTMPSAFLFDALPQATIPADIGDLVIQFGGVSLKFTDCAITSAKMRVGSGGRIWSVSMLDRRWRWQFNEISGHYNQRRADGSIQQDTEKTPEELIKLLLEAMKEKNVDLSQVPDTPRPLAIWNAANPAQQLEDLAEYLGLRIVLGLDDKVKLLQVAQGKNLPTANIMSPSIGIERAVVPDSLKLIGAPVEFQARIKLEAVAFDVDDKIKLVADLSYKPISLHFRDPRAFTDVTVSVKARELAQRDVFKLFRPVGFDKSGLNVPELGEIESIDLVQLLTTQVVEQSKADEAGVRKSPDVFGVWHSGDAAWVNVKGGDRYEGTVSIDLQNNLVRFNEPLYQIDKDDKSFRPPELYIETAFTVDDDNGFPQAYFKEKELPPKNDTGPFIIRLPEFRRTVRQKYADAAYLTRVGTPVDNLDDLDTLADSYLDNQEKEYRSETTSEATYAGIVAIEPDGAIQQVSWSFGVATGATTHASRNGEHGGIPPYKERRLRQQLKRLVDMEHIERGKLRQQI